MKPALASVVLCSQYQMERWSDKKMQLESDLENVKRMVESALAECQTRYDSQFAALQAQKKLDNEDLKKRLSDIDREKAAHERQNQEALIKMERENFVDVKSVEKRFTDKLEAQE